MIRMFEVGEITKLLAVTIGNVEAVGETNEDERRLDNLKTLIDVTNWCLDGLQFAMASGYGRPEYSMAEISYTAQCALDEYGKWIADVLEERRADRKTENSSEKPNNCEHITEDGVTCAKYPACDDCPDNPLNKVKGSERLLKGSDPLHDDCFDCDKFFTCDDKGDDYKTDCPWK